MPIEYKSKIISYLVTKEIRDKFKEVVEGTGKKPAKLKRNWALNFMKDLNPDGSKNKEFKVANFTDSGDITEQVHFGTIEEKTAFIEYCDMKSITTSDFFRTCEINFIKTGNPNGDDRIK